MTLASVINSQLAESQSHADSALVLLLQRAENEEDSGRKRFLRQVAEDIMGLERAIDWIAKDINTALAPRG